MNVRIYSVHIEGFFGDSWTGWDVVNIALTNDAHAASEAMEQGLKVCREGIKNRGGSEEDKPNSLRVNEVRFIGEGQTASS